MSVAKNRTKNRAEAAGKVAESIGTALGRMVNRLEALDAEREKVYAELLALQERLNVQVARAGKALGDKLPTTGGVRRTLRSRRGKKTTPKKRVGTKARIRCGVCGTVGHNARGHARWQAAQGK